MPASAEFEIKGLAGGLIQVFAAQSFAVRGHGYVKGELIEGKHPDGTGAVTLDDLPPTAQIGGFLAFHLWTKDQIDGDVPKPSTPENPNPPVDILLRQLEDRDYPRNELLEAQYLPSFHRPTALDPSNYTIAMVLANDRRFANILRTTLGITGTGGNASNAGLTAIANDWTQPQRFTQGIDVPKKSTFGEDVTIGAQMRAETAYLTGLYRTVDGATMQPPGTFKEHDLKARQLPAQTAGENAVNLYWLRYLTHDQGGVVHWVTQSTGDIPIGTSKTDFKGDSTLIGKALKTAAGFQLPEDGVYRLDFRGEFIWRMTVSDSNARWGQLTININNGGSLLKLDSFRFGFNPTDVRRRDNFINVDYRETRAPWRMFSGKANAVIKLEISFQYVGGSGFTNGLKITLDGTNYNTALLITKVRGGVE